MASAPPLPRWLALLAVLALVGSGGMCAHAILTGRADFQRASPTRKAD